MYKYRKFQNLFSFSHIAFPSTFPVLCLCGLAISIFILDFRPAPFLSFFNYYKLLSILALGKNISGYSAAVINSGDIFLIYMIHFLHLKKKWKNIYSTPEKGEKKRGKGKRGIFIDIERLRRTNHREDFR